MFTTLLIIYAALITILFLCTIIGASAQKQDAALFIHNDRIIVKDFLNKLAEAKTRISELETENCQLKEVISRQDKDLDTCHKLMNMADNPSVKPITPNSYPQFSTQKEVYNAKS